MLVLEFVGGVLVQEFVGGVLGRSFVGDEGLDAGSILSSVSPRFLARFLGGPPS